MRQPTLLRQPSWVIQTASADRSDQLLTETNVDSQKGCDWIKPGWNEWMKHDQQNAEQLWLKALKNHPDDILLLRGVNKHMPSLIKANHHSIQSTKTRDRVAVLVAGELRCFEKSRKFLKALSRYSDLFICTSESFRDEAYSLPAEVTIVNQEPFLPIGSMQQWHKLSITLQMMKTKEERAGIRYSHAMKLRTDYYHTQPRQLLKDLTSSNGLICASDKVFGGKRELMLLFEGFYSAIISTFDQNEQHYWPINVAPILRSDFSHKWYGMAFPKAIVGEPKSVEELKIILKEGGSYISNKLLTWKDSAEINAENYVRFFKGNSRFASEICFARFLNFNSISTHTCSSLTGFLRNDRFTP